MKNRYKAVFWDFDGVWSKDYFYKNLAKISPKAKKFTENNIFGSNGEGRPDKWMRAEMNMNDINELISKETGVDFNILTKSFLEDVSLMEIEMRHIPIIENLKQNGVIVGMVTNNMDVFDVVTRPRLNLDKLFNGLVFNSFAYKKMKSDGLFDIAMSQAGLSNYSEILLIDDSQKARDIFESNGGNTYAYTNFEDFKTWANKNLLK
jgi:FMN phosphatase YigB (HAD superfamily)